MCFQNTTNFLVNLWVQCTVQWALYDKMDICYFQGQVVNHDASNDLLVISTEVILLTFIFICLFWSYIT